MTYAEKLKDPRWQKKRLEIMQRDGFACRYCGDKTSTLQVHHLKYIDDPWDARDQDLVTLCDKHHDMVHSFEKLEVIKQGALDPYDFIMIDPLFINMTLIYLENHEGIWVIKFRDNVNPHQIIKLVCMLYRFISPIDCDIRVRVLYDEIDVYRYLNDLTIPIDPDNA